jgi:hypothetical protein
MHVIFSPSFSLWPTHLEMLYEFAQRALEDGNEVTILECDATWSICDMNLDHSLEGCLLCRGRTSAGLHRLRGNYNRLNAMRLRSEDRLAVSKVGFGGSILQDLKDYGQPGFGSLGLCVASSLISLSREENPDVNAHRPRINRMLRTAYALFLSAMRFQQVDAWYIFNGRFFTTQPYVAAARASGVPFFIYERSGTLDRLSLYKNHLPHDRSLMREVIRDHWETSSHSHSERQEIGASFYEKRAAGLPSSWYSFVEGQSRETVALRSNRPQVVAFTSSDDELAAVATADWRNPLYADQCDAIAQIASAAAAPEAGFDLTIRAHPNLRGVRSRQVELLRNLPTSVRVIMPDEAVSSYELLRTADVVLSFGSTVGIEATYWGKPSILAGRAAYEGWDAVWQPATHTELLSMLTRPPQPKAKENALPYGYFQECYGVTPKHTDYPGIKVARIHEETILPEGVWASVARALGHARRINGVASIVNTYHRNRVRRILES